MALPPLPPEKRVHNTMKTHAVFSSLYAYVTNLHLWHTKAEKQLQDELMKGLGKCSHRKTKFLFKRKSERTQICV